MVDLDKYRLDIDEAMAAAQVDRAGEAERRKTIGVWQGIQNELEKGTGPFAQMLWAFREDAKTAMQELVYADATDAKNIARLQANVQRCIDTMEHVDSFRTGAEAARLNEEQDLLDEDSPPITVTEDDE